MSFRRLADGEVDAFFDIVADTLQAEDRALNEDFKRLSQTNAFYADRHHGVWWFSENIIVYLLFRALLARSFPIELGWEHPYPGATKTTMDLAMLRTEEQRHELIGCFEAKAVTAMTTAGIKKLYDDFEVDASKMRHLLRGDDVRRFSLLFWVVPDEVGMKNILRDLTNRPGVVSSQRWHRQAQTDLYEQGSGPIALASAPQSRRRSGLLCVSLLEVLGAL